MKYRDPTWAKVALAWGLLLSSTAIVLFEMASGYGSTWPIIGPVPSTPEWMVRSMDIAVFLLLVLIVLISAPVLAFGTWIKRSAISIPFLLSALLLISNVIERILK